MEGAQQDTYLELLVQSLFGIGQAVEARQCLKEMELEASTSFRTLLVLKPCSNFHRFDVKMFIIVW